MMTRFVCAIRVFYFCVFMVGSTAFGQGSSSATSALDAALKKLSQRFDLIESGLSVRSRSSETADFIQDFDKQYVDDYLGQEVLARGGVAIALYFD